MNYVRIIDIPKALENSIQIVSEYEELKEKIHNSFYGEGGSLEYGLKNYFDYNTETIVYNLIEKNIDYQYLISKDYLSSFDVIFVNSFNFLFKNQVLLRELKKVSIVVVWDGIFKNLSKLKDFYHAILTCSEDIKKKI